MPNSKSISLIFRISVVLVFGLGLVVRLVDIDDPPLDFNPTRQLRSAIIARGIFYRGQAGMDPDQRSLAISHAQSMEKLEPPILETFVALIYRLIGFEVLWVPRLVSTLFWLLGAAALYDLGSRMESSLAALLGVSYYLFLPFGIRASRAFQPDPAMVMLILLTGWALFRWVQARTWHWALMAGVLGGLSGLVKPVGLFFVGGMTMAIFLYLLSASIHPGIRKTGRLQSEIPASLRNLQIWMITFLLFSPTVIYYLIGMGDTTTDYFSNWTIISRWRDTLSPSFYLRWMIQVDHILNLVVVMGAFIGTLLASGEKKVLLWGFWAGYIIYGLVFPYHILTHDYYQLPLLGVVSLSLIPLLQIVNNKLAEHGVVFQGFFVGVILVFAFYNGWIGRSILLTKDYRDHPQFWQEVSDLIPPDAKTMGITQDYGFRLMYYGWRKIDIWPPGATEQDFESLTSETEYFLITAKNQLEDRLARYLEGRYPVYSKGTGYLIYDLTGSG